MATSESCSSINLESPTCVHHEVKELVYVCENCSGREKLACSDCVTSVHKGHNLDLLYVVVAQKKEKIRKLIDAAEKEDKTSYQKLECLIDAKLKENEETVKTIKHEIQSNADRMKEEISQNMSEKLALCDFFKNQNAESLRRFQSDLESHNEKFMKTLDECKGILDSDNHVEIFLLKEDIRSHVDTTMPKLINPIFRKCDTAKTKIKEACGHITVGDNPETKCDPGRAEETEPVIKSKEQTEKRKEVRDQVHGLVPLSNTTCPEVPRHLCATYNGLVWIGSQDKTSITCIDSSGEVLHMINCCVYITGMSVSPTTNHVWVCGQDCGIREILTPQPIVLRFFVDNVPTAICLTSDEKVIVGMPDVIKMYTLHGNLLQTTSTGGLFTKPLVVFPTKIAECSITHDIAVISKRSVNTDSERVLVLNSKLKRKYGVTIRMTDPETKFEPIDVCYLHKSIFVLQKGNCVHYIDSKGNTAVILAKFKTAPVAMAQRDNTLCLAFEDKSLKLFKAPIHK